MESARLAQKLSLVTDHRHPRTIAQVRDFHVKIVKAQRECVWHTHEDEDGLFLVLSGELTIKMRGGDVRPGGELFVVTKVSPNETSLLVMEKARTAHTGADHTGLTIEDQERI